MRAPSGDQEGSRTTSLGAKARTGAVSPSATRTSERTSSRATAIDLPSGDQATVQACRSIPQGKIWRASPDRVSRTTTPSAAAYAIDSPSGDQLISVTAGIASAPVSRPSAGSMSAPVETAMSPGARKVATALGDGVLLTGSFRWRSMERPTRSTTTPNRTRANTAVDARWFRRFRSRRLWNRSTVNVGGSTARIARSMVCLLDIGGLVESRELRSRLMRQRPDGRRLDPEKLGGLGP